MDTQLPPPADAGRYAATANGRHVLVGILSDTHDALDRTERAIDQLIVAGAELIVHCGDLTTPEIVATCARRPMYFVFGNHDCDVVPDLLAAAETHSATCLKWGGQLTAANKTIAVAHGHLDMDIKPLLESAPDYLFSGHSHSAADWMQGNTRRINPGALFRASPFTVAILDLATDNLTTIEVSE